MTTARHPRHATVAALLADAAASGGTAHGPASQTGPAGFAHLMLTFTSRAERDAYKARHLGTWAVTGDRCHLLDYSTTWTAGHGFGLHLTTHCPAAIGRDRFRHEAAKARAGGSR